MFKDDKVIQELEKAGSLHVVPLDCKDLEGNKTDLVESVCIASGPVGQLLQGLDADQTALHLALVSVRCEGLENDPNRAISDSKGDSLSLLRPPHQGKGQNCSSTGETGLMSHGGNSNSMSDRAGAGGVIGHNSITGVSTANEDSTDPEFRCEPCSNLASMPMGVQLYPVSQCLSKGLMVTVTLMHCVQSASRVSLEPDNLGERLLVVLVLTHLVGQCH